VVERQTLTDAYGVRVFTCARYETLVEYEGD
jgi:hypothetical protein